MTPRIPIEHAPRDGRSGWRGLIAWALVAAGGLAIVYAIGEVCR